MHEKDNYLRNTELSTEQNANMLDGIIKNPLLTLPVPVPEEKPMDKVIDLPPRKRGRERLGR